MYRWSCLSLLSTSLVVPNKTLPRWQLHKERNCKQSIVPKQCDVLWKTGAVVSRPHFIPKVTGSNPVMSSSAFVIFPHKWQERSLVMSPGSRHQAGLLKACFIIDVKSISFNKKKSYVFWKVNVTMT